MPDKCQSREQAPHWVFLILHLVSVGCLPAMLVGAAPSACLAQAPLSLSTRFATTDAMVPMRDGVKLHTKVYVPIKATGSLPIIMLRTPYGIDTRAERHLRGYLRDLVDDD